MLFFEVVFLLYIFLSYVFIRQYSLGQIRKTTTAFLDRIEHDLLYVNGKWDTTLYNADPLTPYPNGSSGFSTPLYIITAEGFVIERTNPIGGFLDASDYQHLLQFQTPETLSSTTNESWRIFSKPIGEGLGVIVVSYYNPQIELLSEIDEKLRDNLSHIEERIAIRDGRIDTSNIDVRTIHFDVSFEVVDRFNTVLLNNGRVPTFIDTSYLPSVLEYKGVREVRDNESNEPYQIASRPLYANGTFVGVIVSGQSTKALSDVVSTFLIFSLIVTTCFAVPLAIFTAYVLQKELRILFSTHSATPSKPLEISQLSFNKKESLVNINEVKVEIPYASNQYYLCSAVFQQPKRRWENDELLELMGEEEAVGQGRRVYDAAIGLNKKLGIKLVLYEEKTYRLNPQYLNLVDSRQ